MNCVRNSFRRRLEASIKTGATDIQVKRANGFLKSETYAVPLLDRFKPSSSGEPQILIVAPTGEAVDCISSVFNRYREKSAVVVSASRGVDRKSLVDTLRRGSDYVIGTPGRLKWLFDSNALESKSVKAIVLEDAPLLLTSPAVLDFMRSAVPSNAQRIVIGDSFDDWLKDSLCEIYRRGHSVDHIEVEERSRVFLAARSLIEQLYCRVSVSDESRQLGFFCDSAKKGKSIVFCRSSSDLHLVDQDPKFSEYIVACASMSPSVRQRQLERFRTAAKAVLMTDLSIGQLGEHKDITLIVHWGLPKRVDEYIDRLGLLCSKSAAIRSIFLLRAKEMDAFSKFRAISGIIFKSTPPVSPDELSLTFAESIMQISQSSSKESEDLVRMHGDDFVAGLLAIMESHKALLVKKSPLSGLAGFVPVLLVDPFMKKVRNSETADKLIRGCLRNDGLGQKDSKLGRIALSAKGYVVDVPKDSVSDVIDSKNLAKRNLKAVVVTQIPLLVESDRLFSIKRAAKDRKTVKKLVRRRSKASP